MIIRKEKRKKWLDVHVHLRAILTKIRMQVWYNKTLLELVETILPLTCHKLVSQKGTHIHVKSLSEGYNDTKKKVIIFYAECTILYDVYLI